jgi:hypothetical protein
VASDSVAVTHDEVDGLGLYAEFGMIEEAFADPTLLLYPDYRRRVRAYLDDPTIPPVLFAQMAARDPSVRTRCSVNGWGERTATGRPAARS